MHVQTTLNPLDRVLMIINDNTIYGTTRFQKYGFLLYKQYGQELKNIQNKYPELKFYDDWEAYHYGPYSKKLENDLEQCITENLIRKSSITTEKKQKMDMYVLTIKGRRKWRALYVKINELSQMDKKIKNLQKIPHYTLIRQIYNAYPEFTTKSKIKDQLDI